jgi:hypothetical protein
LALAIRAALALAGTPSTDHQADLTLLDELCSRLPSENATDYAREAQSLIAASRTD